MWWCVKCVDRNLLWLNYPLRNTKGWKRWCADIAPPSSWPGVEESFCLPLLALTTARLPAR